MKPENQPRENEIPFKEWLLSQSKKKLTTTAVIYLAYRRGDYPTLKVRKVNRRVWFVRSTAEAP